MLVTLATLLIMPILISIGVPGIDAFNFIGSGFGGFFLAGILPEIKETRITYWMRRIAIVCFIVWQTVVILVFFIRGRE